MAQEQPEPLPTASVTQQENTSAVEDHIPASIKNFDDIAKQMISMESLMVTLYFGAFTFTKLNPGWGLQLVFYLLPLFFILISVYSALNVFFPTGYLAIDHVGFRQAKIEDIVRHKLVWFRITSISFVLSIVSFLARSDGLFSKVVNGGKRIMNTDPRAIYDAVAVELTATSSAITGKMFGMPCLKNNGKAFAGYFNTAMIFKLAAPEHGEALALSDARLFDPMGGRPMKEWVEVPVAHADHWPALARAAQRYVDKG